MYYIRLLGSNSTHKYNDWTWGMGHGAVRDAQVRFFIAEEMGIKVKYPIEIFIDNAAGADNALFFRVD